MGGVWKKVPSPFSIMWSGTGIVIRSMLILGKLEWCQRRRMCGDGAGWFRYHTGVVGAIEAEVEVRGWRYFIQCLDCRRAAWKHARACLVTKIFCPSL